MKKYVLAIDPGNVESGFALVDTDTYKPIKFGKIDNYILFDCIHKFDIKPTNCDIVIERIVSFGMSVGQSVFDTCIWIGRFQEFFLERGYCVRFITRADEKITICHSMKANDSSIRIALADRFRTTETDRYAKGTKKNPGFFYGLSADAWSGVAIATTYIDKEKEMPF